SRLLPWDRSPSTSVRCRSADERAHRYPEVVTDGPSLAFEVARADAVPRAGSLAAPRAARSTAGTGARGPRPQAIVRHAAPGHPVGEPRHVRGRGGRVPHAPVHRADAGHWHGEPGSALVLRRAGRLALPDGPVRELRDGAGGGARQGAG